MGSEACYTRIAFETAFAPQWPDGHGVWAPMETLSPKDWFRGTSVQAIMALRLSIDLKAVMCSLGFHITSIVLLAWPWKSSWHHMMAHDHNL